MVLPVLVFVGTACMPLGAYLCRNYHPRVGILIAAVIGTGSTFAASFLTNFWAFLVVFGGGYGVAGGIIYMIPIVAGWEYFPNRKGMVSGVIISGFSCAGLIFNQISTALANPTNASPIDDYYGKEVYERVPRMLRILTLCWGALLATGFILITKAPVNAAVQERQQQPRGREATRSNLSHFFESKTFEKSRDFTGVYLSFVKTA